MSSSASLTSGKYTRDLKLRVLEHYFRNGGDVFGNKQSTAKKFGVDSKTVNRFLKIPDLVRLARKNAKSNKSTTSSSSAFKEPPVPGAGRSRPSQRQSVRITLPTEPDESIVNQTANGNTSSIGKLLKIFELGTQEIRDLLAAECDLIYECRVCRGLFRSVANLLTHKRRYCTRPAADTRQVFGSGPGQSLSAPSDGVMVLPLPPAVDRLPEVRLAAAEEARAAAAEPVPPVRLEPLPGSSVAMVQTVGEPEQSVGARLEEVRTMEAAAGRTVKLGPDGCVVDSDFEGEGEETHETRESEQVEEADHAEPEDGRHVCQHCNTTFSTRKTLSHHIRSLHSSTRIYFPCSLCSAAFINMFSVERHLQKVHKKKQDEVEVLKEDIKKKSFQRSVTGESQSTASTASANMPLKMGPVPAGLLRCVECLLCYPSVQLLAAHQLTAHARAAERRKESGICVRNDHLKPRTETSALAPAASAAAASLSPAGRSSSAPPRSPAVVPSDADMESRLTALTDLKRMQCRQCGSLFKTVHNLRRHIAGHIGWTRHGCPRCSNRYYSRFDVLRHMKRKHGVAANRAEELLRRSERQMPTRRSARTQERTVTAVVATAEGSLGTEPTEVPLVASPPVLPRRRPGRKSLADIIHYIRSSAEPSSPDPLASSWLETDPSEGNIFQAPGTSGLTAIAERPRSGDFDGEEPSDPYDIIAAVVDDDDGDGDEDDDLEEFMSLSSGAELEPGAVWRTLPPLVPLLGVPRLSQGPPGAEAPPPASLRQRPGPYRLTDSPQQHDCNENFEHRHAPHTRTPPSGTKSFPSSPIGNALSPCLKKYPSDELNLLPRVLLTDIAVRRWNSSPTPARPASPSGCAVYPAGARLDSAAGDTDSPAVRKDSPSGAAPTDRKGSPSGAAPADRKGSPSGAAPADRKGSSSGAAPADRKGSPSGTAPADRKGSPSGAAPADRKASRSGGAPADRKGSPSGAANTSGGVMPNGIDQERRGRGRPPKAPGKSSSEAGPSLMAVGATEAATAAAAAGAVAEAAESAASGSPPATVGRPRGSGKSRGRGQRSVSAPGRVVPARRWLVPTAGSPERSPGADRGRGGVKTNAEPAVRRGRPSLPTVTFDDTKAAPAVPAPVPYVPSVWPPLVRKRSWSSPSEPPLSAISAAEAVKRRRHRRLADHSGVK